MYQQIYKSLKLISAVCIVLVSVMVIMVIVGFIPTEDYVYLSLSMIFVLVTDILIYVLCVFFSSRIAKNITKPIGNIDYLQPEILEQYPELKPLLKRLLGQSGEIQHQMEKVKRQKLRLQMVSESMNEGLVVLDVNFDIISANKSACQIFGDGNPIERMSFFDVVSDSVLKQCLEESQKGEKISSLIEIEEKTYRVYISPVIEEKEIIGTVVLLFDISEEAKNIRIRREFSANVSHELKTPLTTIHGYSQIINNGIAKQEDIIGFTKKIEKESSRLIELIDDIIKLSKLDEVTEVTEPVRINLLDTVQEVVSVLSDRAAHKGIEFIVNGEEAHIDGIAHQIYELVYNLCDNAIKYNNENGKVYVKVFSNGFSVEDTGIGIPEEYRERVFERFFRVDKSRSKTVHGTGLGLSIVKHIVMSHGGNVRIEDREGAGTRFVVTFDKATNML